MDLPKTSSRKALGPAPALGALVLLVGAAAAEGQTAWWNRNWPYRRLVTVPKVAPTRLGGQDVAVVDIPTAGLTRGDGRDIRVVTAGGTELPSRVLLVGPGDTARVAFALLPGATACYVYLGNPEPRGSARPLELRRGVLMETWEYPGGGIRTLKQVRAVVEQARRRRGGLVGRGFRDRVFVGHNPFGPQNRIVSVFTAWLVCPSEGSYRFACSSQDASFLLVDGKLVVDNGGHHPPQRDIRKQGTVRLTKGLHELRFYHVNVSGHPVAVVAWQEPGGKRVWPIPPEAFAPVVRARPGRLEQYGRSMTADFLPRYGGECFVRDRYYQRWIFEAAVSGRSGRPGGLRWDFGDGQVAAASTCEHVYLAGGLYTVTLTMNAGGRELTRRNRLFVSRPWDRVTSNRLDAVRQHAEIVGEYDFSALDARSNAEAVLLLERAGASAALRRAGEALLKRSDVPAALVELAVPLYAEDLPGPQRVAAYLRAEQMTSSPAVRATMAERAGRTALEVVGDTKTALEAFTRVVRRYGPATTVPAVRLAKIGLGDVWRAQGRKDQAAEAYRQAGYGPGVRLDRVGILKGDYARHVEDYLRAGQFADAAEYVRRWERDIPPDKLEGYWSLLVVEMYMKQRAYDKAAREAMTLVNVNPESNYADKLLQLAAAAYGRLGRDADRRAALRRIVEKYPESPLAAEAAGQLGK